MSDLQKIHSQFNTPDSLIKELIYEITRETVLNTEKIVKGYDSEVYAVETDKNNNYIFKIKRRGAVSYQEEIWALNLCANNNIPVPKTLIIDEINLPEGKHEITIQAKLKGQALADIRSSLTTDQINTVLRNAGKVLSSIHEIKVEGFNRRDVNGEWDFSNWERFIGVMIEDRSSEKKLLLEAGITEKEFNVLINALEEYRTNYSCQLPVLCHGDFLPEHIFVDENLDITGILDFGMYEGNHPIHDFAFFEFEAPNLSLEALIDGYSNKALFDDTFRRRLLLHKIPLQMGHLAHHMKEKMLDEAKFNYSRLKDSLQELQQA